MIKFLFKGVIRDKSRSFFPIITVMAGVLLCVVGYSWINGAEANMIDTSAKFNTGHVKIMSRAYAEEADQIPNDLAYIGVESLTQELQTKFPDFLWTPRIRFGGLLDIPDEKGETRAQGPVVGLAVDLFSDKGLETEILSLKEALLRGHIPNNPGEILISEDFAVSLDVQPGDIATLISSTMYGSMAVTNFTIAGTIRFGVAAMDRGAMIADIEDIQLALDMENAAGEILGFFKDFVYRDEIATTVTASFNVLYSKESDEFSPVMDTLRNQTGMAELLDMMGVFASAMIVIFVVAMSIVLWNAGLMGSLRRYGEIGVRLAMGETKTHLYRSMIIESLIIGFIGTVFGTILGLTISYYLQAHGVDFGSLMKNASLVLSNVMRAKVTWFSHIIGFIPGFLATFLGAAISGLGIFRRETSQLIKELEA
ncbi:MAG: FtsX-like permease family protein [Candidatus Aminicenantes bacterium]